MTPTELLEVLFRFDTVLLLDFVPSFPTRVPTVLERAPVVVDERGLVVMGEYLGSISLRMRLLFGTGQGALFRSWKSSHTA